MKTLNVRALQIEPLNDVKFVDLELSSTNVLEDTVVWEHHQYVILKKKIFTYKIPWW